MQAYSSALPSCLALLNNANHMGSDTQSHAVCHIVFLRKPTQAKPAVSSSFTASLLFWSAPGHMTQGFKLPNSPSTLTTGVPSDH